MVKIIRIRILRINTLSESISLFHTILSQTAPLQMGRTVLHYAAGLPDAGYIYSMLTNAGAKEDAVDLVRRKPKAFHCVQCLCMVGVCTFKGAPSEEVMLKVTVAILNYFTFYDIILQ